MGSYKWGYKSPNTGYNHCYLTYNPTYITTPEPPSRGVGVDLGLRGWAHVQDCCEVWLYEPLVP